jgi:hypothetical protein
LALFSWLFSLGSFLLALFSWLFSLGSFLLALFLGSFLLALRPRLRGFWGRGQKTPPRTRRAKKSPPGKEIPAGGRLWALGWDGPLAGAPAAFGAWPEESKQPKSRAFTKISEKSLELKGLPNAL